MAITTLAALALGACASTAKEGPTDPRLAHAVEAGKTEAWRKVHQVEKRYAVYINEPGGVKDGDLVATRLVYVYMPGEVHFEGKEAAYQEYKSAVIDCAKGEVKLGRRVGFLADGKIFLDDDHPEFEEIAESSAIDDAARARCQNKYWVPADRVADGPNWFAEARKHVAAGPSLTRPD
jgi:hypothetical protein